MSPLHEAALAYAARGWFVFPIVPNRKAPALIEDYYTLSSKDPAQINAWWKACPQANIGLDCGKSGIIAVDIDSKEGHGESHHGIGNNFKGLRLISGGAKVWGHTLISRTPTNGYHYLFEAPPKESEFICKSTSKTFGCDGIDTRSQGGYIVLPPSCVPAGKYNFLNESPLQEFPRKLLSKRGVNYNEDGKTDLESKLAQGELIGKGQRDNFLISYLGKFRDWGLEPEELRALVEAAYHLRCDPAGDPYTSIDFDRLVNSVIKYPATKNLAEETLKKLPQTPGVYNKSDDSFAISAHDFLTTHKDTTEWIVDSIFQRRSVNMMMGAPKAGKSTLTKHLALTVAYGLPFLGRWKTVASPVLIYTLQENKEQLKEWLNVSLQALHLESSSTQMDFIFRLGNKGTKAITGLAQRIEERPFGLVIIDMLAPFIGVENLDNYTEVDAVTSQLNALAQDYNTTIVWTHHERKTQGSDLFSGSLGSTAIRGAVYTTVRHWKDHGRFYIASEQRAGTDIEPCVVHYDKKTNDMRVAGSKVSLAIADHNDRKSQIEQLLAKDPGMSAHDIRKITGGRYQEVAALIERIRQEKRG